MAGAGDASDAALRCGSSFAGTTTWLVQYIADGLDVDYTCGNQAPPRPPRYESS